MRGERSDDQHRRQPGAFAAETEHAAMAATNSTPIVTAVTIRTFDAVPIFFRLLSLIRAISEIGIVSLATLSPICRNTVTLSAVISSMTTSNFLPSLRSRV